MTTLTEALLTSAQVAAYRHDGFVIVRDVFSAHEIDRYAEYGKTNTFFR